MSKKQPQKPSNRRKRVNPAPGAFKGVVEALEPRLLFNADVAAVMAVDPQSLAQAQLQVMAAPEVPAAAPQEAARTCDTATSATASAPKASSPSQVELVFVDARVHNAQQLVDDLLAQQGEHRTFDVHWLDAEQDGVTQITDVLAQQHDVAAIHLISHGADGAIELGSTRLDQDGLAAHAMQLSTWSASLQTGADLLLYGCDVAASARGQAFVKDLALLTGTDVAASTDDTGAAALGGNWVLEFNTGAITAAAAPNAATQADWQGLLALGTSGGETRVNSTTAGSQTTTTQRQVGMDASGNYVTVWQSGGNVQARVLSASGANVVSEFTVAAGTTAQVAMNASGQFVVVWDAGSTIKAQRYNADGTTSGSTITVSSQTTSALPAIALNDSGNFVVSWSSNYFDNSFNYYHDLNAAMYSWSGTIKSAFTVSGGAISDNYGDSTGDQIYSSVAINTAGNVVIVSSHGSAAALGTHTNDWFWLYDATGTQTKGKTQLNQGSSGVRNNPSVGLDDSGNFIATWTSTQTDAGDIYGRRFNSAGTALTGDTLIHSAAANTQTVSSVGMDVTTGRYVVAYQDSSGSNDIYLREFDASGNAVAAQSRVNTTTAGSQSAPSAAFNGGYATVVWTDPANSNDIMSQRYTATNATPVNTVPSAVQAVFEDAALVFSSGNGNQISIADADAGSYSVQVTLSVSHGSLTLAGVSGLSFTTGDGSADATMVFTGTVTQINTALNGLSYTGGSNYNGLDTLSITTNDQGHTGTGGAKSDADTVVISVVPVNDATANSPPASQNGSEDATITFSTLNGNLISVNDPDAGSGMQITVSVLHGSLSLSQTSGLSFTAGDGTLDASMTFKGALTDINAALDGMVYTPTANYNGADTLTIASLDTTLTALNIDTSLKGRYAFENTGALGTDSSPASGYPATVTNVSANNDATRGNVASMVGTGNIQINSRIGSPTNVTTAAWINVTTADSWGTSVITIGDTINLIVDESFIGDKLAGYFHDGSGYHVTKYDITLAGTGWHHVAYTVDSTNNAQVLYLDGVAVSSTTFTQNVSYNQETITRIGKFARSGFDNGHDLNGKIDEARIYSRALSAAEIAALANDRPVDATDSDNVALTLAAVNDAPVYSGSANFTGITEDQTNNSGQLVSSLFTSTDVDSGAVNGIALYGQTPSNGTWQYSTNNGASWTAVGSVATNSALMLRSSDYLRFVPDARNADAASLNFYVWDQTSGSFGSKVDASTRGGTTAFSSSGGTSAITVSAVNDAPVYVSANAFNNVTEDQASNGGQLVSTLLGSSDVDSGALNGIALYTQTPSNGTWQYSLNGGSSWSNVGTVSGSSALLLKSTDLVRFVPDGLNADAASIGFYIWDQTSGASGSKVDVGTRGGSTAFSSSAGTSAITATAVNDAPVLAGTNNVSAILEDAGSNSGTLVSALISGQVSDVDSGAASGIAVTSADNSNGTWQYTTNGGSSWTALGSPSDAAALLLAANANTAVRFVPNADWNGAATLGYRAWDQSSGSAGNTADASSNGGTSAFSSGSATPSITVNPVNDAPTASATALNPTFTEAVGAGTQAAAVNVFNASAISTVEAGQAITSLSFTVDGLLDGSQEKVNVDGRTLSLGGNSSGTTLTNSMGYTVSLAGGTATITLTSIGGITPAAMQTLLDGISYQNTNTDNPSSGNRVFTLTQIKDNGGTANGGNDTRSLSLASTVNVAALNDNPVANDDVASTNPGTMADVDVKANDSDPDNSTGSLIVHIVSSSAGTTASVNGDGSIHFDPGGTAGAQTVTYYLEDPGLATSANAVLTVTVVINTPPTGADGAASFSEDTAYTLQASDFGFTDADVGQTFGGLRVETLPSAGSLALNGVAVSLNTVIAIADINAGHLVFTPALNGNGSPYANFSFKVQDNLGAFADAANTFTFHVDAVDDAPVNTVPGAQVTDEDGALAFSSGQGSLISVADIDAGTGAIHISLSALHGALSLSGTSGLSFITGDGSADASMAFTGTLTDINAALAGLVYNPDANYNGGDTLTLLSNDQGHTGTGGPLADSSDIAITVNAINDAPVLLNGIDFAAITEDQTNNAGQLISSLLSSSDADSGAVNGMALFNQTPGNGSWQYSTDNGGTWHAVGTVSSSSALLLQATDRLRLVPDTANGSTASVSFYAWDQTFGTSGNKVDASARSGTTAFSASSATSNITVSAVNDAPTLSGGNAFIDIEEDDTANGGTLVSALIAGQVSDVDSGASGGVAITAIDNSHGTWQYTTDGGATWAAFGTPTDTTARLLAADADTAIRFVPAANWSGTAAITLRAWDTSSGTAGSTADASVNGGTSAFSTASATSSISVIAVNDAPVLTGSNNFSALNEDDTANSGTLVSNLIAGQTSDVEDGSASGIAVVNVDNSHGAWQFTTNGGATWLAFGTVADTSARLLSADANTAIRFVPNADWNGTASITLRAWDQSSGSAGGTADASSHGARTAFSAASASPSITVNPVNDAPVNLGPNDFSAITEDQANNPGQLIASLFNSTDADSGAASGIALFSQSPSNGNWQYSDDNGATWTSVGAVSGTSALLLPSTNYLRFVPDGLNADAASVAFYIWDQSAGTAGSLVDVSVRGGTTALSSSGGSSRIAVTAVNDAPVLSGIQDFTAIDEDDIANSGTLVSALIAGHTSDVDHGASTGVAITGADTSHGAWQFTLDGGNTWAALGSPTDTTARLLSDDADTAIRFVPDANWSGTASITLRAWDRATGTAGGTADTSSAGSTSAFSAASASPSITVNAINDAPVNTAPSAQPTAMDTGVVFSNAAGNAITVSDVDAGNGDLALTLSVQHGRLTLASTTGLAFTSGSGNLDNTMNFTGPLSRVNAALDGMRYTPDTGYTGTDTLLITASDEGQTGAGGIRTSSASTAIDVRAYVYLPPLTGTDPTSPPASSGQDDASASDKAPNETNNTPPATQPGSTPGSAQQGDASEPGGALSDRIKGNAWVKRLAPSDALGNGQSAWHSPYLLKLPWANNGLPVDYTIQQLLQLIQGNQADNNGHAFLTSIQPGWSTAHEADLGHALPHRGAGLPTDQIRVAQVAAYASGLALTIGTVWWTARVSGLLTSLLISTPAWRAIDPLPILMSPDDDEDECDRRIRQAGQHPDDEHVENLFTQHKPLQQQELDLTVIH